PLLREIAIFSSFIFVNMVVDQINWNVDKYIIGRFRGPSEVAVYAVAANLRGIYVTFSTALYGLFVPRVNQMVSRSVGDHALTELLTRVGRIQFVLLAPIAAGFVFLGEPFVVMWAGGEYRVSYLIALIMILPNSILLIQNLAVEIQRAKNMHQFFSWVYLGMAIANISISIPLTYRYGALGAAVGTALAYILGHGLIMNWYYHKRVGLNMRVYWSGIARVAVALGPIILTGIVVRAAINLNEVGGWLLGGAIFALLSAVSLWFVGMNTYEKKLFSAPVKKLLRRA
ncbi:MAG: polysaccharide biosynthesis protein, partial [Chloroflexia bacterium]|nr:polysaccharide biosynthesis protein [Chloroflexia bacterium]